MTFEEFFAKKKIDLTQLKRVQPALYEEFRGHYAQMGEKSFDHTKKYWFNRLRKEYLLMTEAAAKPTTKTASAPISAPPANDGSETSSAKAPTGFKPRFKPAVTKAAQPA